MHAKLIFLLILIYSYSPSVSVTVKKKPYRSQSYNRIPFIYDWHLTDKNQFWCDANASSIFQTQKHDAKMGYTWWTYRCPDQNLWLELTRKQEEGAIGGALFLERARGTIFRDWILWFEEHNLDHFQFHIQHEMDEIWTHEHNKVVRRSRTRNLNRRYYEPVGIFINGAAFFLLHAVVAFTGVAWMTWLSYLAVQFGIWFCYYASFVTFVIRKFFRLVIATIVDRNRKAMWFHAKDQKWFIWIRTSWKMWYIFRDHILEEQPHYLVFRKPPNLINYANTFLSKREYHKYDLHIWEINFIDDMLEESEEYPAIVAWTLKCFLGEKYNQYCIDHYDLFAKRPNQVEDVSSSSSSDMGSGSDSSEENEEKKKEKAKKRLLDQAKRYADLRVDAEAELFKRLHELKMKGASNQPAPSPFDYNAYLDMDDTEQKGLVKKAKDTLGKYEIPSERRRPKSSLTPTKEYLERTKRQEEAFIPLINTMVWPEHLQRRRKDETEPEPKGPLHK